MSESVNYTGMTKENVLKGHRSVHKIMDWIDEINMGGTSDEGTGEIVGEIATTGSHRIEEILTMLRSIVMTMGSIDVRMSALEAGVLSMNRRMTHSKPRTAAALKIAASPVFKSAPSTPSVSTPRNHEREGARPRS